MDKPEEISQEIWEQAEDLFMELRDAGGHDIPVIARAILKAKEDEREECAKILDHMADQTEGLLSSGARFAAGEIRLRSKLTQC